MCAWLVGAERCIRDRCMVEPDKIVKKYYRNENGRNVATDTDDINYDNIYLRLSLLGVQQVANGENFIKFNIE